jgi:hypothetical protein
MWIESSDMWGLRALVVSFIHHFQKLVNIGVKGLKTGGGGPPPWPGTPVGFCLRESPILPACEGIAWCNPMMETNHG